jgi:hypothetical protein
LDQFPDPYTDSLEMLDLDPDPDPDSPSLLACIEGAGLDPGLVELGRGPVVKVLLKLLVDVANEGLLLPPPLLLLLLPKATKQCVCQKQCLGPRLVPDSIRSVDPGSWFPNDLFVNCYNFNPITKVKKCNFKGIMKTLDLCNLCYVPAGNRTRASTVGGEQSRKNHLNSLLLAIRNMLATVTYKTIWSRNSDLRLRGAGAERNI